MLILELPQTPRLCGLNIGLRSPHLLHLGSTCSIVRHMLIQQLISWWRLVSILRWEWCWLCEMQRTLVCFSKAHLTSVSVGSLCKLWHMNAGHWYDNSLEAMSHRWVNVVHFSCFQMTPICSRDHPEVATDVLSDDSHKTVPSVREEIGVEHLGWEKNGYRVQGGGWGSGDGGGR